ncbi:type II secretion system GspH family protein [bacterium]|nr:type II secretion system GspH family protein [bacterium]MBU1752878.1 type II secretion system GspH family protein [bacterium]
MKKQNGFTLIELIIVCAIIGLLSAICIVRLVQLIDKAREVVAKANLCSLRAAIAIYYGDTKGLCPVSLDNTRRIRGGETLPEFIPRYMQKIPQATLRRKVTHNRSNNVTVISTENVDKGITTEISDEGGWIYSSVSGDIRINCTCKDSASLDKVSGCIYYSNYGHEE